MTTIQVPETHDQADDNPRSDLIAARSIERLCQALFERHRCAPSAIVSALWGMAIHHTERLYGPGLAATWLRDIADTLDAFANAEKGKLN